ncbi:MULTISPECIES: hypothetical protein [Providencia]|uniref:hypothetical protein n=1 Tax=Providencia TaxID=586 RepID=UPI001ADAAC89|nr:MULTISPECIES: hypothetical protein [Providencia]MBO8254869.1 hypothetical protein [Providencia rettgeri]MBO8259055.1 hypothetical protein [Providencia rettgeri]MDE4731186.1 hypothetical protein [Providencia rettgeri]
MGWFKKPKISFKNAIIIAIVLLTILASIIYLVNTLWSSGIILTGSMILYIASVRNRGDEEINLDGILSLSFIVISGANLMKDIIKEYNLSCSGILQLIVVAIITLVIFIIAPTIALCMKKHVDRKIKS